MSWRPKAVGFALFSIGFLILVNGIWAGIETVLTDRGPGAGVFDFLKGVVFAALPVIGGLFSLKRKYWALVLAASISPLYMAIPLDGDPIGFAATSASGPYLYIALFVAIPVIFLSIGGAILTCSLALAF